MCARACVCACGSGEGHGQRGPDHPLVFKGLRARGRGHSPRGPARAPEPWSSLGGLKITAGSSPRTGPPLCVRWMDSWADQVLWVRSEPQTSCHPHPCRGGLLRGGDVDLCCCSPPALTSLSGCRASHLEQLLKPTAVRSRPRAARAAAPLNIPDANHVGAPRSVGIIVSQAG